MAQNGKNNAAAACFAALIAKEKTLAAAESCTGGLVAARITDIPGASRAFRGGVVSYTNDVKADVLGVSRALLDEYGAVSEPVARAMAEGVRRVCGADFGVSVTGVAGPDTDERGNGVGTVYVALAASNGTQCRALHLGGATRAHIRAQAADAAFSMVKEALA
ncbi:MAG: nicotinamide-nucleotide amidohydrolase family protein [Oscillospiraceae bacterium]|nr:nicotinamide-nucleotide amidohydrolase family protein [Oscillospiraceae bacterium]